MQSMTQQFRDWAVKQDPAATFNPWDADGCAGHQFLVAHGYPVRCCWMSTWNDTSGETHYLPQGIYDAISWACDQADKGFSPTFGALAERLANTPARSGDK